LSFGSGVELAELTFAVELEPEALLVGETVHTPVVLIIHVPMLLADERGDCSSWGEIHVHGTARRGASDVAGD
jgi:hypothetical protein